jgi:SMI1 / KNR4 family (SUKH-1)
MSTLTDALERILNWLQANHPKAASSLQPGLSYEEIEAKLADLPFRLPQEVYELYQWRNGSSDNGEADCFDCYRFIPLEEAIELSKYQVTEDLLEGTFPFGWFPLFEFNGGYLAVIGAESKNDNSPIVCHYEDESIAYTNLTGMMLTMAECYETGAYEKNELEEDWQANCEKEKKLCIKYNPEVLYFVNDREFNNYYPTHQKIECSDGSVLQSFYNPHSGLVAETRLEDATGYPKEQTDYLGKQIICKTTYINNQEGFQSYFSEERWYASHDKYEEITVLVDRKNSKTIKRRYINGVLKQEQEKIQPVPNPVVETIILVGTIFLIISTIIAFIVFVLALLISIIKWLMGKSAIAIYY